MPLALRLRLPRSRQRWCARTGLGGGGWRLRGLAARRADRPRRTPCTTCPRYPCTAGEQTHTHTLTQTDARRWSISQETRREAGEVFASVCSSLALRPRRTRTRPRSSLDNIAKLQDAETSLCVSSVRGVMNNSDCRSFSGLQWEVRKTKQSTRKRCNYSLLDVSPVMIRRGYTSRTKIQSAPLATCGG